MTRTARAHPQNLVQNTITVRLMASEFSDTDEFSEAFAHEFEAQNQGEGNAGIEQVGRQHAVRKARERQAAL